MKKHTTILLFSLLLAAFFSNNALAQDSLSARQVIEKNIEAQGGLSVLEKIQTVRSEYKTTMEGHSVIFLIKEMLPNKGSFEIIYQGRTVYKSIFDGKQGYTFKNGQKVEESPEAYKDKFFKKNIFDELDYVGSSRVDLQACKLEYSIVSPK